MTANFVGDRFDRFLVQCRSLKFAALFAYGKARETSLTLSKIPAWRSSTTCRNLMVMTG